ncbi:RluA family pseudouridine synthase [Kiritimatiellota bacterium B12222]|nr:RluA family pseudouridine synthase [Kiritimatiellota bacterium B12222]
MSHSPKPFKTAPKKYQPRGAPVIYEDKDLLVVNKACGLLSVSYDEKHRDTAYHRLFDFVRKGNPKSKARIFMVHRIDRDTSGVLLFAKTPQARRYLLDEWKNFSKQYCALVYGQLRKPEGELVSYLLEDEKHVMQTVAADAGGQYAKTAYKTVQTSKKFSLMEIGLFTGRKNQIRAQFAEIGHPVVGDRKYGHVEVVTGKRLFLHAEKLTITHPFSKEKITFTAPVPPAFEAMLTGKREPKAKNIK